jgi:ABC-type multidrug transport system fused ATPase/permease subunit
MTISQPAPATGLLANLRHLYGLLPSRQRRLIGWMLVLQIIAAGSEILSLGAVIPFLGALANAPQLLSQPAMQPWLHLLSVQTPQQLVVAMAVLFGGAIVLSNALRLLTIRMQFRFSAEIGNTISAEVYRRTLYQPYSFHTQHSSSEIIALSTSDAASVSSGLIPAAFYFATNSLIVIAITVTLVALDPWVALAAAVVVGGAYGLIIVKTREALHRNGRKISELNAQSVKAIQEGLGGIRDVLIDGTQPVFESAYRQANRAMLQAHGTNGFIAMSPRFLVEPIAMCAIAALAVSMAYDSAQLQRVLPLLGALALGANRLLPALQQCFVSLAGVRGNQVALTKVNQALCRPISPEQLAPVVHKLKLQDELRFEDVWFSYPSAPSAWVLKGVNISIKANSTVAFIGATGCGKSTMADLILGLLQPQRGQITVDGTALTGQQMRAWQAGIAHVPQQIYLSDATIAENIAFGVPRTEIDMALVQQAAKLAHIADFIEKRPLAYQEMVGERGVRLSGGQRQRIGIARALYKQASVIVFDEATSALDNTTEKEVMAAIEGLSHHLTIILIAHRLSTIKSADAVYEFLGGQISPKKIP